MFHIRDWIRAGADRGGVTLDPPVKIRNSRGYLPDVAWHLTGRDRPLQGQPYPEGAPDLAIEVLSPSTRAVDPVRKRADCARVGVRELWLIDPDGPTALCRAPSRGRRSSSSRSWTATARCPAR